MVHEASREEEPQRADHGDRETVCAIGSLFRRPPVFERDVPALDIAEVAEPPPNASTPRTDSGDGIYSSSA
jgi:hypothetical protein